MLTAEQIAEQGRRFACCSFDHLIKSMRADIIGETACAEKEWNQSLKAYWAATVMGNTVLTGGCYTMAYATEVASIVGCLCEPVYGCNCPEDSCFISVDEEAIYVPCSTLVNAWVFSGAGDTDLNGVTFIPGPFIPEAEPDTEVFVGGDYTLYELAGAGYYVVDETIGVHLYQGALGGVWTADTGASPAPTQAQGTLGDLCSTDLTPSGRISMAVSEPVNAIYAMDCCGEMELFVYESDAFDPYNIPVNDVISINGVLWTNTGTTVGPLFPPLTLSYTWVPQSIYRLTTDYPDMAAGRDIALQGYGPNGWYDMWRGSEDDLPVDIDLSGLVFTGIRARYTLDNGCEYLSTGTIVCEPNVPDIQEVIGAVDTSEREAIEAAGPEIGDSYLVVSGESNLTWNAGYIVTWGVGAYWDAELVHEGDFVLANNTSVYWLMYLGELVQIVPPLVFTEAIPDVSFSLVSAYPTYATYMNRSVVVTAVIGGSTVTVYEGLEGYFSVPRLFTFDGAVTDISITYTKGPCSWTAGFVEGVCGDIEVTVEANEDCDTATYFVTVDITSVTNYPLGNQYATVNGVAQAPQPASIGPSVLGPFAFSDVVFVTIENSYNVACNYVSDTIIHPQAPEVDYLVSMAVDASLQAFAPPSAAYYIVSNVNSVVNTWSIHVGDVWTGTDWVTPSDGDVIRAESPSGVAGYWQQVSGGAVQIFPPGLFTYNTVTQVTVVSIEEVAPFIAGSDIVIQASCGVPEEIYSGPIASFTPFGFSPVCDIDVLTGTLNYFNPCWIPVGVNVESFTPTGDPEPFATTGLNSAVQFIFPQDDGKFICVGLFTLYGATSAPRVTRLNADGTLDTAFNTNIGTGPVGGAVRSAAIDSLGRVYVAGDFTSFNGNSSYPYLVRLLTDGTIDTSFVVGTSFNASVYNVMVQPDDDKVIAIGTFITYNSVTANRIIRLETDGSTDVTFNSGTGFNGPSNAPSGASKIDANGTILVSAGFGWTAYDGNIVLPGGPNPGIVRINPDGSFNSSLTQGTVFNGAINNLSVQSDGMYLITGAFTMYNGTAVPYIARLDNHGVLDTTFNIGVGVGFSVPATSNTPLPNGQMLIGTGGGTYQGLDTFRLVRLNNDGTRDFSYNTGPGFNDYVSQTVIMPLGTILVSGNFTTYNGLPRIRVALLN